MFRKNKRSAVAAFTLLEVLVVIVIIAIITTVAVLAFSRLGRGRDVKYMASQLAVRLPLVAQQSVLQSKVLGVRLSKADGFEVYDLKMQGAVVTWVRESDNSAASNSVFSSLDALDIRFQTKRSRLSKKTDPQLIFKPSGLVTPVKIMLTGKQGVRYSVQLSPAGDATWQRVK